MVRVGDVGKMGVLSMEVLVEATCRCVMEMRMRDQGLGGGDELGEEPCRKEMEPTVWQGDAGCMRTREHPVPGQCRGPRAQEHPFNIKRH